MQNYYEIDPKFYWQAVRELLINKIGFYLYDKDIEVILHETQFQGNTIYFNVKSCGNTTVNGCQFKVELSPVKIKFCEYQVYDESNEKKQLKFDEIISKFTRVKYLELLSETADVSLKPEVVKVEATRKPGFSRSAPHLFDKTDADTAHMMPKKKLSIPAPDYKANPSQSYEYDIKALILTPPNSHSNPKMLVNLLILHSLVDSEILKYFRFSHDVLMLYIRPKVQMDDLDIEYFMSAMSIHGELKSIAKEKKLGPKKAFYSLFPKNRQEDIQLMIEKNSVTKVNENSRQLFRAFIIKKSLILPEFFYYAFLSCGIGFQAEFEEFIIDLFENNKLNQLIDIKNPQLADQVIRVMVYLLNANNYQPSKKIIDICMIIITDYISTYNKLPNEIFSHSEIHVIFKKFDSECASKMFLTIKKLNLSEDLFLNIRDRLVKQKKVILAKALLTHDFFKPYLTELSQSNSDDSIFFCLSMLCIKSFEIDMMVLAEKKFESCWEKIAQEPVGAVLLAQMVERICLEFEFSNLVTDVADARAFAFGKDLARDSSRKLEAYKQHLCLSFSEVKNAFLIEQAIKRTESKNRWLQIHKSNMLILAAVFKPHIIQHIKDIPEIHKVFKQIATKRLVSMDADACNPDYYELNAFPEVLKIMISFLSIDDKMAYRKGLEEMRTYFNVIEAYKTINMSGNSMIGYISTVHLVEEIFNKFPNCIKNENDKRAVAVQISLIVLEYFEKKTKPSQNNNYFTTITRENVRVKAEVLFIEGWKATEFLSRIKNSLSQRLALVDAVTPGEFLSVVRESCEGLNDAIIENLEEKRRDSLTYL